MRQRKGKEGDKVWVETDKRKEKEGDIGCVETEEWEGGRQSVA